MKRGRFNEEQTINIPREAEAGGKVAELCRRHGISDATFYTGRNKYGGLEVSEMRRLRQLEEETVLTRPCRVERENGDSRGSVPRPGFRFINKNLPRSAGYLILGASLDPCAGASRVWHTLRIARLFPHASESAPLSPVSANAKNLTREAKN
jgi:putative transposase